MKYSDSKTPLVCMQRQSTCYKSSYKMEVYGVLFHSTGANNPTIRRYVQPDDNEVNRSELLSIIGVNQNGNDWNHIYREAGLNAWIGKLADGSVASVQTMPWDFRPWGSGVAYKGGPSCNSHWIQFEICEDGLSDEGYFNQVYQEACELTAYLCKLFGLDPQGAVRWQGKDVPVILCHQDAYQYRLGSNHGDIYHWFPKYGKNMQTVRDDVQYILEHEVYVPKEEIVVNEPRYNAIADCPGYAQSVITKIVDKGFIGGTGTGKKDENGRPADLSLSLDMIRTFVVLDRVGVFDLR